MKGGDDDEEEMKSLITTNIHIDELDVFLSSTYSDDEDSIELMRK